MTDKKTIVIDLIARYRSQAATRRSNSILNEMSVELASTGLKLEGGGSDDLPWLRNQTGVSAGWCHQVFRPLALFDSRA
jgi:hypothetical protein